VRLLLDSHAYLWWLADDPRLSKAARDAISRPDSLVHVSSATIWELGIKSSLGRLDTGGVDLVEEIRENGFAELAMTARHAQRAAALPRQHDDPFDRMLIAQAETETLTCVTRDAAFAGYGVPTLW